jgi:hypothetical protein
MFVRHRLDPRLWKYPIPMPWGPKRFRQTRHLHFLAFSCYKLRPNFRGLAQHVVAALLRLSLVASIAD